VVFLPCNSLILHFDSGFLSGLSPGVDVGLLNLTTYICVSCVIAYICYFVFFLFFASHRSWELGFYFLTCRVSPKWFQQRGSKIVSIHERLWGKTKPYHDSWGSLCL
jgi:hypothetical protein